MADNRIGFIGLGHMGAPMAWNLHAAGFPLTVYNRSPERAQPFADTGIELADTPAALTRAVDTVILMVTDGDALMAMLHGEAGVLAGLSAGQRVVNMSTVHPEETRAAAEAVQAAGGRFVDAPVSGTVKPAQDATLVILAGGEEADVQAVEPALEAMGKKVLHCGGVGQGTAMKMVVNLMLGDLMHALAEGLSLGKGLGLDSRQVLELIGSGPLAAPLFNLKGEAIHQGNFAKQFPIDLLFKDLGLILDTAGEAGVPLPQTAAVRESYSTARAYGHGDEDMAAIIRVFEQALGSEIRD